MYFKMIPFVCFRTLDILKMTPMELKVFGNGIQLIELQPLIAVRLNSHGTITLVTVSMATQTDITGLYLT